MAQLLPDNVPTLRLAHGGTPGHQAPRVDSPPSRLHPADTLERMQALSEYDILDTPAEATFDAVVRFAAEICGTEMAAMSLVCDDRQWFKATHGMAVCETPIEQSICAYALDGSGLLVINDAASHAVFRANELVSGSFGLRFYAGAPIHSGDGVPLGALCVLDTKARNAGLSSEQAAALRLLVKQIEAHMELRRSIKKLERQAKRELQLRRELEHSKNHDSLTGLPDRRLFRLEFEKLLAARCDDQPFPALFLVDIDDLNAINNGSRHEAGDLVLVEVARRLQATFGRDAIVARVGSDEFAVLIRRCRSHTLAAIYAEAIIDAVNLPFFHDGRSIDFGASLGYALATPRDDDFATLFWKADLALTQAKAAGRGSTRGFTVTLARAHDHERAMIERARMALAENKVVPHYQPKVNLETGRLIGFEALLRIETPDGHIELPASVAAAFEDRELSVAMTDRMVDCIIADIRKTTACRLDIGHVAINTTSFDFSCRNFAGHLLSKLGESGIPPAMIEVEVTESVALGRGRDHVRHALVALADAGVPISLDDFGTGHASLTNVKQLPISALKIDRSFTGGLGNVADDSIVHAMATLCARMGLSIVAEGVESEQQLTFLRQIGVLYGQGLYFSPAVPCDNLGRITRASAAGYWAPAASRDLGLPALSTARRGNPESYDAQDEPGSTAAVRARQGSF